MVIKMLQTQTFLTSYYHDVMKLSDLDDSFTKVQTQFSLHPHEIVCSNII